MRESGNRQMDWEWSEHQLRWLYRKLKKRITKKPVEFSRYAGKEVLAIQAGNDCIRQAVLSGGPFMACRFGNVELNAMTKFEMVVRKAETASDKQLSQSGWSVRGRRKAIKRLCSNAGFFPEQEMMGVRFAGLMQQSCGQADLIGVWFNPMEDYMIAHYAPQAAMTYLRGLEPWYSQMPWTMALKDKRVLVIHPFADTIEKQYDRRELLFPGTDLLPEFQLRTVKAVQTIAGTKDSRFENWFEALDWMEQEAMKEEFDIAIIGCGAYGLPLAARLKAHGRQAIHLGGAAQLLFGIRGARWDNHEIISRLFNESWVRPSEEEKPAGASQVEGACYW